MKNKLEQRSYFCEVRAEDREDGTVLITGKPIVYNSKTDLGLFDEIIEAGALDNTDLTDVRLLINHNLSKIPLARSRRNNGNSTMQLTPTADGMEMAAFIDVVNNMDSKALRSAVNRGDITGMSFMFSIRGERWENLDSDHPIRYITDIESVVEVSAVTFPAYEQTEIFARDKTAMENAAKALESARQRVKKPLENGNIELEKAKTIIITGGF
jgi:HK97 family phage prohead protease